MGWWIRVGDDEWIRIDSIEAIRCTKTQLILTVGGREITATLPPERLKRVYQQLLIDVVSYGHSNVIDLRSPKETPANKEVAA